MKKYFVLAAVLVFSTIIAVPAQAQQTVAVPNVVGMSTDQAVKMLEAAGLRGPISFEITTNQTQAGKVTKQNPAAGQKAVKGSAVALTAYMYQAPAVKVTVAPAALPAAAQVTVPNVVSMNYNQARAALQAAGLRDSILSESTPDQSKEGKVAKQSPPAGQKTDKGNLVSLTVYVYQAPPAGPVAVPNVVGMTYDQARAALERAGFNWDNVTKYRKPSNDPKLVAGLINYQDPKAGQKIPRTDRIWLWGDIYEKRDSVTVPNLYNLPEAEAKKKIEALGLYWGSSPKDTPWKELDGKVIEQSPAAGQSILLKESIKLSIGRYTAAALEVRVAPMAGAGTYLMTIKGGTPPFDVSASYDVPKGLVVAGGKKAVEIVGLQDSPNAPGIKSYRIIPHITVNARFTIIDARGSKHLYDVNLKQDAR